MRSGAAFACGAPPTYLGAISCYEMRCMPVTWCHRKNSVAARCNQSTHPCVALHLHRVDCAVHFAQWNDPESLAHLRELSSVDVQERSNELRICCVTPGGVRVIMLLGDDVEGICGVSYNLRPFRTVFVEVGFSYISLQRLVRCMAYIIAVAAGNNAEGIQRVICWA